MKCQHCGAEIHEGKRFCSKCDKPVTPPSPAQEQPLLPISPKVLAPNVKPSGPQNIPLRDLQRQANLLQQSGDREKLMKVLEQMLQMNPELFETKLQLAELHLLRVNLAAAQTLYEELIAARPSREDLYTILGAIYETRGLHRKALEVMENLHKLRPVALETTDKLLDLYLQNRFFEKAIQTVYALYKAEEAPYTRTTQKIKAILEYQPNNPDLLMVLGEIYLRNNQLNETVEVYQKLSQLLPNDSKVLRVLSETLGRMGRREEAVAALQKLATVQPDDLGLRLNLAESYKESGQPKKAIEQYRHVLDAQPNNIVVLLNMAQLQEQTGELEKALVLHQRLTTLEPDNLSRQEDIQRIERLMQKAHLLSLQEALRRNPEDPNLHLSLAQALTEEGSIVEAIREWRVVAKHPEHALQAIAELESLKTRQPIPKEVFLVLKDIYSSSGESFKAQSTIEEMVRVFPDDPESYVALAELHLEGSENKKSLDNYQQALEHGSRKLETIIAGCRRIVQQDPLNAEAYKILGSAEEAGGNVRSALRNYREALQLSPSHQILSAKIGILHFALGEFVEATEAYRQFLLTNPLSADTRLRLSESLWRSGNIREAKQEAKIVLQTDSANRSAKELLQKLETEEAQARIRDLETQLSQKPGDPGLLLEMAQSYRLLKMTDRAIECLQRAAKAPAFRVQALQGLAEALLDKGFADLAVEKLNEALSYSDATGNATKEILYSLGELYESSGQVDKAIAAFKRLYGIDALFKDIAARLQKISLSASSQPSQPVAQVVKTGSVIIPTSDASPAQPNVTVASASKAPASQPMAAAVADHKPCPYCGASIKMKAKFCSKCGHTISN